MQRLLFTMLMTMLGACGPDFNPNLDDLSESEGSSGQTTGSETSGTGSSDALTTGGVSSGSTDPGTSTDDTTGSDDGGTGVAETGTDDAGTGETGLATCGDGVLDGDEECDTDDFGGLTCQDFHKQAIAGDLVCGQDCTIRTDHCASQDCGSTDESLYMPCQEDNECINTLGAGTLCYTSGSWDPLCTRPCIDDTDCLSPASEGCGAPSYCDSIKQVCLLDCSISESCPNNMVCQSGDSDTGYFCNYGP